MAGVGVWLTVWILSVAVHSLPSKISVVGLFDSEDIGQEIVFSTAVNWVNDNITLPHNSSLEATLVQIAEHDSFRATKKVCSLLQTGIAGIFGPQSDVTSMNIQSISDALEVPHVETRWDIQPQRDDLSINLYPRPSVLSTAYVDVVKKWEWKSFSLVYEEPEGVIRLQDFLKEAQTNGWRVQLYQFEPRKQYRDVFWQIKKSHEKRAEKGVSKIEEIRIVLDVSRENLYTILKHAQQVGLMTENENYLITSLDFHTIDLEDFKYGKTSITALRLVDEGSPEYSAVIGEANRRLKERHRFSNDFPILNTLKTESALMYDAVKLFATTLIELDHIKNIEFPPISCEMHEKAVDGSSVVNYMKSTEIHGLTRTVKFDREGFRSEFTLDLLSLTPMGLVKIGTVTPGIQQPVNITVKNLTSESEYAGLSNRKYTVTTTLTPPYAMLKESAQHLRDNARYEGYCIELVEALAATLHFDYEIKEVGDKKYGIQDSQGNWNGMIGEVISGVADMAIVDLTITSKRQDAVEFTTPFMNTGISILFKKPTQKVTTLFSFLSPFSMEVWVYVMAVYMGVSVILFVVGRLCPYEWMNPHPCRQENQILENNFSLLNSMWFTIGSLMQQGSDVAPTASSTRTIAGIWYFFTLIMISSYTANLAAFLTVEKVLRPFESAEDLSKQTKIKYGCMASGSTKAFFNDSKIETYERMWKFMSDNQDVFVANNDAGQERVMMGDYAYLMESASIEYIVERKCNLTQIGGLLDNKGYGIATRKGSNMAGWLSSGILKLQEEGKLHDFKERWWKQKKGGGQCADASKQSSSAVTELGLGNVGGVFVVLLAGVGLSAVVAMLEFLWEIRSELSKEREPIYKLMLKEFLFALSCSSSTKPARQKSEAGSIAAIPEIGAS